MTLMEAIEQRHSVRQFEDKLIDAETAAKLKAEIDTVNHDSGLHIQLFTDESEAFKGNEPHYGQFSGCKNYFALVGKKGMDEKIGYYGQRLVLYAQQLGLNTCWVALTYKKGKVVVDTASGEKLYIVIALGYGKTQGAAHKVKEETAVSDIAPDSPDWYRNGVKAALLAPTAMNQQKFKFSRAGDKVNAKAGMGFYTKIDLGIVKYNFEIGAGKDSFNWA
ncbi:nitroreductase [Hornefia porci]|uniref:Nitroreductase n=1 Tax=Hornefia porci TaxID=2652292 RepID=A0A1Q9JK92_9FIRM|nr:nitroreductase family protein [Hornefia porci]OLR56584.1 nitroreductase [Hornefia porci]